MYTTGEDDQLVFPQNLSTDDDLFLYASDENNAVDLIHHTTEVSDTSEAEIQHKNTVYAMVYDRLEARELENVNICDDSDSRCGQEH